MTRSRDSVRDAYDGLDQEWSMGDLTFVLDGEGDPWIGTHDELEYLPHGTRDDFTDALRDAGLLEASESAEPGAEAEESDATPVEDVMDFRPGDYVTAQSCGCAEFSGNLDHVEVHHTDSSNPYIVHFEDGSDYRVQTVEPAEEPAPSPEDVAERWIKATDSGEKTAWVPVNDSLSVDVTKHGNFDLESEDMHTPVRHKDDQWFACDVERVDADEVPAEEVVSDE